MLDRILKLLLFVILSACPVLAQSEKARLTGTLTDATGAVVSGVEVSAINSGTGVRSATVSNEAGVYSFPLLDPGTYELSSEKQGFRNVRRAGIELHVNGSVRVDFTLEVGSVSESVSVTAAAPLLQEGTSDLGHVVQNRQIMELPLNGRNTVALAELAPGIRPQGTFGANAATVNYVGWGNFSANGGIANANETLIDGVPATTASRNNVVYMPSVDGTQEFKVQTNNFSAEFDRTAGGVINLVMKSGTNELHGSLYEFLRNDALDANDFFANRAGNSKPSLRYNQFGGSVGGPIRKNKAFVFGTYEGFRQGQGRVLTTTVPTVLERAGDFSETRTASGALLTIYDPLTTRLGPDGRTYIRDAFPGNRIPAARFDPLSVNMLKFLWPEPNGSGAAFSHINNYNTSKAQQTNSDQFSLKGDHHFSDRHNLSASYAFTRFDLGGWDPFNNRTTQDDVGRAEKDTSHFAVLSDTFVLNPTTLLEVRAGFSRFTDQRLPLSFGQDLTALGLPASFDNSVQFRHIPVLHVSGISNFASSTGSVIRGFPTNYSLGGALTLNRGKHGIKTGTIIRRNYLNRTQNNVGSGDFTFNEAYTRANPLTASANSGFGFASYLLGYPASGTVQQNSTLAFVEPYFGFYVQDDWRVSSRLTLNLGLRYSIEPFISERYDRLSRFDADLVPQRTASYTGLPLRGGLEFMSDGDRSPAATNFKMFAPRFGLSYNLFRNTVLRGGYGIFWLPGNMGVQNGASNNSAYSTATTFVSSNDGNLTPSGRFSNPFPNGILQPPGSTQGADTLIGQALSVWLPETRPGYMQQWNFGLQRQIGSSFVAELAYAGSKGTNLPHDLALNQLPNQYLALGTQLNQQVPNPFFGSVSTGTLSTPTVTRQQLLLPYPQFLGVTGSYSAPIGNSTYHSMQALVTQRFGGGGVITLAYTLAKNITDTESKTPFLEAGGQSSGYLDSYNRRLDKAIANFDVTHRAVVHYNYELPFWKRRRLLSGWQVNGITTLQSGVPVYMSSRPNLIGDPHVSGSESDRLSGWFATNAFSAAPQFTYGNAPRTLPNLRTDGISNFDFSAIKNTRLKENLNVQFRAEFFNVLNHVTFGPPNSAFGTSQFGTVSLQNNTPRQIQFALKLLF